jgi:predicted DCC family thiol-disulfide oxidoreductase YuxK
MQRLDSERRIDFQAIQTDTDCPLSSGVLLARFHARERNGPILSGAAAFAAMWRAIPLLRPLGLAAGHDLVLKVLERAYTAFLRIRPKVQRMMNRFAGGATQ